MQVAKLSISLPQSLLTFIENYQLSHAFSSHSQVIEKALELLRKQELEATAQVEEETDQTPSVAIVVGPAPPSQQTVLQRMGGVPEHLLSVGGLSDRETRQALINERIQARNQARL